MTHRNPNITFYTILVGLFVLSFGYNIHLYTKLQTLENSTHFTRCGTSEFVCYMFNIARNDFSDNEVLEFCQKIASNIK